MSTSRKLVVRVMQQRAELFEGERLIGTYPVSTAANGLGCETGSFCTPTGRLRVAHKIGAGCERGTVFRARVPTNEVWRGEISGEDLVLTRVLWLEGDEPQNANTLSRYIYLHGTNDEAELGRPVSHGCVRFSNRDIEEVFELLEVGSPVVIDDD